MRVYLPEQQVHHQEAPQISPRHLGLQMLDARLVILGCVAQQHRRLGHRAANRANAATHRLHDSAQHRHVSAPLPRVRRPETKIAAEQRADQRLVERAPHIDRAAVPAHDRLGKLLQRLGKLRVAHRLLQPRRRAEVHHVEHQVQPELLRELDPLIGHRPIKPPALRLQHVPRERVPQGG